MKSTSKIISSFLFSLLSVGGAGAAQLTLDQIYGGASLAGPSPRQLQVSPDGSRVSFLRGRTDDQFQLDLWEFDIRERSTRRLLDARTLKADEQISDQEKARRERQRTASLRGIVDYNWSPDGKQLLVPMGGDLYLVDAKRPQQSRKIASGAVLDAKISPRGRYVSYLRGQNLYVYDLAQGQERQLTSDGGGTVHNAEAEFVAQEEMAQSTGYWWAPDDSAIAYKRFDESGVTLAKRFEIYANRTEVVAQRYPYPGTPNVQVGLALVDPRTGAGKNIALGEDKDIYLVRADWSSDARHLGKVYVSSNRDAVSDKQVYVLPLDGSAADAPQRITQADGWHEARFSPQAEVFIDSWSDQDHPPQVSLHSADGKLLTWIERNALDAAHPYAPFRSAHVATEYGTLAAEDGQTLHYSLKKPLNFVAGQRYPVFLAVYGGPGAQTVERRWGSLFDQYMAQQGYVVFRLDNRGSARRERRFTDAIYQTLGKNEVADQLAGIRWLAQQDFVDGKRIGVFGWSYGGYMSLRMLSAASGQIAAGVSVAPVTDWALYDTHYVEQFINRPQENAEGYRQSGVFAHLDGLKSPLLLVHGMADDNVLFTNSTRLIDELSNRDILFELMTYPGAKHGISGAAKQKHVYKTIEAFFARHLKPDESKAF
ncbi:MAG: S9 family peptidase [Burkholderiales bacterium]|nr:S9 family peptidase [Burkholderiales bacterium]